MRKILSNCGFTLVEMLVSVGLLVVLISFTLFAIDPLYQYAKAFDAQKKQDLVQVRNALDLYYNDHNCYPSITSSTATPADDGFIPPFGQEWSENETVYMKEVPQDPYPYTRTGAQGKFYYNYKAAVLGDGENESLCSQWNVLYARLADKAFANKTTNEKSCMGAIRKRCGDRFPVSAIYNYCVISGTLDCDQLRAAGVPGAYIQELVEETTTGPVVPPGGGSATPTPTTTTIPGGGGVCLKENAISGCRAGSGSPNCSGHSNGNTCNEVRLGEGVVGDFCTTDCSGPQAQ